MLCASRSGDGASPHFAHNICIPIKPYYINTLKHIHVCHPMQSYYEQALERCKQEAIQDETYYNGLAVTTSYNMGRLHEALSQFEMAENFYKIILKVAFNIHTCIYMYVSNYKCTFVVSNIPIPP